MRNIYLDTLYQWMHNELFKAWPYCFIFYGIPCFRLTTIYNIQHPSFIYKNIYYTQIHHLNLTYLNPNLFRNDVRILVQMRVCVCMFMWNCFSVDWVRTKTNTSLPDNHTLFISRNTPANQLKEWKRKIKEKQCHTKICGCYRKTPFLLLLNYFIISLFYILYINADIYMLHTLLVYPSIHPIWWQTASIVVNACFGHRHRCLFSTKP